MNRMRKGGIRRRPRLGVAETIAEINADDVFVALNESTCRNLATAELFSIASCVAMFIIYACDTAVLLDAVLHSGAPSTGCFATTSILYDTYM